MSIRNIVKAIQKIMRQDVGVDGDAQRISQMCWMFFLKVVDDQDIQLELINDAYTSPVPTHLRWGSWAADPEGRTGEALLAFINGELFPQLKQLSIDEGSARRRVVRDVFEDAYNYMKSGQLLRQVVNKINDIDFNDLVARQNFGDVYEQILNDLQSAGTAGEYYTPRAVTAFMTARIDPRPGELLLDPACGTGGFLTGAIDHMRERYVRTVEDEAEMVGALKGVEKKPLPHMLCVTNMLLHEIEAPTFVRHDNTLARPYVSYGPGDRVDLVLTNPPFGGMEEPGVESNFPTQFQTRETADLFLALIIRLLKPGGRAAVVLPDGFLYGEGVKTRLKEQLLEECNLHTIVRLPNSVFKPYAGIGTNLFFFEKGTATKEIWFYEHRVPSGQKAYSMTKPIRLSHLQPCAEWWGGADRLGRASSELAWRVSVEEVKERRYNLDLQNPNVGAPEYRSPEELKGELDNAEATTVAVRSELRERLETHVAACNGLMTEFERVTETPDAFERLRRFVLALGLRGDLTGSEQSQIDLGAREQEIAQGMRDLLASRPRYRWKAGQRGGETNDGAPNGWYSGTINETGLYINGRSFKAGEFDREGLPVIRIQNLSGQNSEFNLASGDFPVDNIVDPGDLLVSWSATLDAYIWAGPKGVLNQHIFKVVPNLAAVSREYLYWLLKHEVRALADSQHAHGLGMMHINRGPFLSHVALIPPLAEQEIIVERLTRLMELCDQLEAGVKGVEGGRLGMLDAIIHETLGRDRG